MDQDYTMFMCRSCGIPIKVASESIIIKFAGYNPSTVSWDLTSQPSGNPEHIT